MDYNAGAPMHNEVAFSIVQSEYYNASSVHADGRYSRNIIEETRELLKDVVNANEYNVVFTSSCTEANNLALKGLHGYKNIVSAVEHVSVLSSVNNPEIVPVDENGIVDLARLEEILSLNKKSVVSITLANNETGVIQPIGEVSNLMKKYNDSLLHVDIAQAVGKIPVNISDMGIDIATLSGHKFGSPPGIGALIVKKGIDIYPLITGGGQERSLRAGTENMLGIVGIGKALLQINKTILSMLSLKKLRDKLEDSLLEIAPGAIIPGRSANRLTNTTCIIMPGVTNEVQIIKFDMNGISISSGAACSSGKIEVSHVLLAMGLSEELSKNAIRVSLGWNNNESDIMKFISCWQDLYNRVNKV